MAAALMLAASFNPAHARGGDRTLKLYFGHTKERGEFTFKRNGKYDRRELQKINHFLRDWRRNEPANMDPQLLDLVWGIYQQSGSRDYIHVVSSYRSPATNEMLRSRSSGVAKKSQHTLGKAMDFYIPDVPINKLRGIAMKMQVGGVGYYPKSGSPFVHVDTGSVRAWPRMTREQLIALFPNGETIHLPADGKPLSGYDRALAKYGKSKEFALASLDQGGGRSASRQSRAEASRGGKPGSENPTVASWLKNVFKDGEEEGEETMPVAPAAPAPQPEVLVAAADLTPTALPRGRPADLAGADSATAALDLLTGASGSTPAQLAYAPLPRLRPGEELTMPAPMAASATVDPLAEIAARMDVEAPMLQLRPSADSVPAPAGIEVATVLPSSSDSDLLAKVALGMSMSSTAEIASAPVAVASASPSAPANLGVPRGRPAGTLALAPAVEPQPAPTLMQARASAAEPARYGEADSNVIARIASAHSVAEPQFATLKKPQPAKVPDLFSVPENAESVAIAHGTAKAPVQLASKKPAAKKVIEPQPGFFGKFFASVF